MPVSYKAIGRNIRAAPQKAGFTQERMAEQMRLSTLHYGRLERGDRTASLDQIVEIAVILHTPVSELLSGMSMDAVFAPVPVRSNQIGTIIDFLAAGCSDEARGMMLDVCTVIAQHDKS